MVFDTGIRYIFGRYWCWYSLLFWAVIDIEYSLVFEAVIDIEYSILLNVII